MPIKKNKLEKPNEREETIGNFTTFRRALHARGVLISGLRVARSMLVPAAIPDIVKKAAENRIYRNVVVRDPFPRSIQRLKLKRPLPIANDRVEAAWAASVLSLFEAEITIFVDLRDRYYSAIAINDYDAATAALDRIEKELGFSLWLISARIALLQMQGGTAAQKRYLHELLSAKNISGFTGYLTYLFGFTADDNVSLAEVTRE
ncbi:hypothetical protein ASC80_14965 [Afipia sp. Root123D2]|uniref:hypothetical protein n=1 Tax=Afipia sp. Root123D2 TaxID=1736436 RepID=UPI000713846F|nr:hypothetical protein [Afipia sp. Root123D2]KQW21380.1 hypothetical protein ASC80_14965 [Afipia sp. Root123D2]